MKKTMSILMLAVLMCCVLAACGSGKATETTAAPETAAAETAAASENTVEPESTASATEAETETPSDCPLADGIYTAEFHTDSGMFHVSEALDGKGTLTVENGKMTIHVSLVSKTIVNLFPGSAEDAQKEGAELLQPTEDKITYADGYEDTVYGFDVPVPALDTEFPLALIGKKGIWYDHAVSVTNPQLAE